VVIEIAHIAYILTPPFDTRSDCDISYCL